MSKLSPLLQEVETNKDLENSAQETPEIIVETPAVGKTCPEGSIWDEEQGMCVLQEEIVLDVEEKVDAPIEEVVDDSIEEEVETELLPQHTDFEKLVSEAINNYEVDGEKVSLDQLDIFNKNTKQGKYFFYNLQNVYDDFKIAYPNYEVTIDDIAMYASLNEDVIGMVFDSEPDISSIADVYFSDITDILKSHSYAKEHIRAGDATHDFEKWYKQYGGCSLDTRKDCMRLFNQYIKYEKDGSFDIESVSEEQMNSAKQAYIKAVRKETKSGITEEQNQLMDVLDGKGLIPRYSGWLAEVEVGVTRDEIYTEKKIDLKNNNYLDVNSVVGFDAFAKGTWKGISEGKVEEMIKDTWRYIKFGDGDKDFKITQLSSGGDGLLIQGPMSPVGGRLTMKLNLDEIMVTDGVNDEENKRKTQDNWDRALDNILTFFTRNNIEDKEDFIYMSGGEWNGLSLAEVKIKEKKRLLVKKQVVQSQVPTTSDIINDAYNIDGEKVYTYSQGMQDYTWPGTGELAYSLPVYYRVDEISGERTIIKDKELLADLYASHWLLKKEQLTANKKHDWLYPAALDSEMSIQSYATDNNTFIKRAKSDGTFVAVTSTTVAEILGEKYSDFHFYPDGAGQIIISDTRTGKQKNLSYIQGENNEFNVNSIEKFKYDLILFIEKYNDAYTGNKDVIKAEKRAELYETFLGDDGLWTKLNEEQLEELEEFSTPEFTAELINQLLTSRETGFGQSGEEYLYSDSENKYSDQLNLAVNILTDQMGIKNPSKEMVASVALELIMKSAKNKNIEKNISDWWKDSSEEDIFEFFGSKDKEHVMNLIKLEGNERTSNAERNINRTTAKITNLELEFQNGEDRKTFNAFMETLNGDDLFMKTVTQEDVDEQRVVGIRTSSGGVKYVPLQTYINFQIASLSLEYQLNSIHSLRDGLAGELDKIKDIPLYLDLVSKSYAWGDYIGTNILGGLMGGYIKAAAGVSGGGKGDFWLDIYSDIKAYKSGVSQEAARFNVSDMGLNPLGYLGFAFEMMAEQTESFSAFALGMAIAGGSPIGVGIGASLVGFSSFSGNYMDAQIQYQSKHGNLDNFDEDSSQFYQSVAVGGVNFVSAYVSGKFLNQTYNFFRNAIPSGAQKIIWYESFKNYAALNLPMGVLDATVESITEISENLIRGEEIDWDLAKDVFFETGLFNLLLPTTGLGVSAVMQWTNKFDENSTVRKNLKRIDEINTRIKEITRRFDYARSTGSEFDALTKEMNGLLQENIEEVKATYEKMGELDKGMLFFLAKIDGEQRQIEMQIEDIKKDDTKTRREKQDLIDGLEDQYRDNKKTIKNFFEDDSIKNGLAVLRKSAEINYKDKAKLDRIIEEAKAKLELKGGEYTAVDIDGVASIILNEEKVIESHEKSQEVLSKLNPALAKRRKLARSKQDGINEVKSIYDEEINRLKKLDPDSTVTVNGKKIKVSEAIDLVKDGKSKAVNNINNGGHGVNIDFTEQGGKKTNLTVVENSAVSDRTENETHEAGHDVFIEMIGGDPKTYQGLADVVTEYLKSSYPNLWLLVNSTVERHQDKGSADYGKMKNDELVMRFLELVANEQIKFDPGKKKDNIFSSIFGFLASEAVETQSGLEFNFDIKGSKGAIHFLKTLALKLKTGEITPEDIQAAKNSNLIKNIEKNIEQSVLDIDWNKMSSEVQAGMVNDIYEKEGVDGIPKILDEYGGMARIAADKYANIPGIDYDILSGFRTDILYHPRGVIGLIMDYNPESADYEISVNGVKQTISVTYNKNGDVRINKEKVPELKGFTREQMIDYITNEYGNIVDINQVPLSGYINLYLSRRVIEVAEDNASVRDAIAGITVEQGDADMMSDIADDNTGTDELYDENNENIEEKTGEVRKILNIEKDGVVYKKVINTVKETLPKLTTDKALANPKNQKKYRQALEKEFTKQLMSDLNEVFNDRTKFDAFLREHQDAITRLIAIKYKNKFPFLTYDAGRMDSKQMQDPDNLATGDKGAGNQIWKLKDLTPDEFVAFFTKGRNAWETQRKSLQKSLAAELGLDAVFTALPPSLESKTGKLAEALKRDPYTKFSAEGVMYNFSGFEIKSPITGLGTGIIDVQKLTKDIRELGTIFTQSDFLKNLVQNEDGTMYLDGHDFDPAVVAFVYHNAHDQGLDAHSQYFVKDLVVKNPNLQNNPQVEEFLNQGTFINDKEAQKKQVDEVTNVVTKYMNGALWVKLKGNGFGFYKRAMNSSETIRNPRGPRSDERKLVDNDSHWSNVPLLVSNWTFDYDAKVTIDDVTYTGAYRGMVDGKEVVDIDPVKNHDAKLKSAPHYNNKMNIQNNLDMDFQNDIDIAFEDIRIMNPGIAGGIMDRLDKIMYGSVEEYGAWGSPERLAKQNAALALMMPEIERANAANVDAGVSLNMAWFDAIIGGDASITGLLRHLQLQTGDVKGPRGLSTIIGVAFPSGPKTGKNQGEHMIVTAETSGDIADLAGRAFLLDKNGVVVGYKPGFDRSVVKKELYKIMRNNSQVLMPKEYSKTMDDGPGGNTSSARLNRFNFLTEEQKATIVGIGGLPFVNTQLNIAILNNINEETLNIQEENTKVIQVNTNLADIYSKNSLGVESKVMVADFDETMWSGGDNVIVATNPDTGETVPIASEDFHKVVKQYEKNGWTFDFSDFVNVEGGQRGPYWNTAVEFIKEQGIEAFHILTARQPESALAIAHTLHAELIEDGVVSKKTGLAYTVEELLVQITGLGVGGVTVTGKMKADWIFENIVSNGHTKIRFADDGMEQVEEVQTMFEDLPDGTIEGTSILVTEEFKDTHAKFSNKTNSETFNIFVEETSGVDRNKTYSKIRARQEGRKTGRINNLVPYSAEDFKGLLYQFLGEGDMGEYQFAWFTEKLIKPYSRGESNVTKQAIKIGGQLKKLMKSMPDVGKKLKEKISRPDGRDTYFTKDMAVRVYLWDKNGIDIPGLSKRDRSLLIGTVQADAGLVALANQIGAMTNLPDGYVQAGKNWEAGNILDDMQRVAIMENRAVHMDEFLKNADEIFSEENLNKIEAIHGTKYRDALENMLARMKTGRSDAGFNVEKDKVTSRWDEWVNNSVGAIMFLNGRSAVLQTLSTFNYVKIDGPNNPINAAKAFDNQAQYWLDFVELWNSDYLLSRRDGEKRGINENELAKAVKQGGARGAIAYLLKLGFTPTKLADSFAIASGGATYVRNYTNAIGDMLLDFQASGVDIETLFEAQDVFTKDELNTYLGDRDINDLTEEEVRDLAKKIALEKWEMETETGQQSSRQDMLSQEQTGGLGRLILAFKNTPMQYTRKITRALQDLKNNRGNPAEHIANIAYYGGLQSLMFNGLQQALFAKLDDDDEEWDEATDKVVQGMVDSYIQGMGLTGAVVVTVKNGVLEFKEQDKKGWNADHTYTVLEFANISPTIGSKLRKLYGSIKGRQLNKDVIAEMDLWDPQNPAWSAVANVIEAFTNIPAADIVNKMNNLLAISKDENEWWQNLSLLLGWNTWDVDVETKAKKLREELKSTKKQEKKAEANVIAQEKVDVIVEQEVIKEKEGKGTDVNTCAGVKSSGERCSVKVDKAGGRCQYHASADEKAKMVKCSFEKPNGEYCKLPAVTDAGRCNTKQHQPGYKKKSK